MTLSEIETILTDLSKRHTNLDKELLNTILLAAGWEDKFIKDAIFLFEQRKKKLEALTKETPQDASLSTPPPVIPIVATALPKEEITFYKLDGEEEGELHIYEEPLKPKEEKIEEKIVGASPVVATEPLQDISVVIPSPQEPEPMASTTEGKVPPLDIPVETILPPHTETPYLATENVTSAISSLNKEPESLIVYPQRPQESLRTIPQNKIPENLPLIPFESSPHVWPFSRYRDVFHKEQESRKVEEMAQQAAITAQIVKESQPKAPIPVIIAEEEEISLEKTPMTRGDESLVFLAGAMLLGIILILGYMYSNGRL